MLLRVINHIQIYTSLPKPLIAVFYLMKYGAKVCDEISYVSS
jgi:hypothetical protein